MSRTSISTGLLSESNYPSTAAFTFFAWVLGPSTTALGRLAEWHSGGSTIYHNTNGNYTLGRDYATTDGVWNVTSATHGLSSSSWNMIAWTHDGTTAAPLFYANAVSKTVSVGTAPAGALSTAAGAMAYLNRSAGDRPWASSATSGVAVLALFSRVLSAAEIADAYNNGRIPLDGIVRLLPLGFGGYSAGTDLASGATITDSSTTAGSSDPGITLRLWPAPSSFAAGTPTTSAIPLSWAAVTGAVSYLIERSADGGTTWTNLPTQTGTSYTDSGLASGTTYTYRISTSNAYATGAPGSTISAATAAPATAPAAPTSPSATANSSSQITVAWTAATGATSYTVQYSLNGPTGWNTLSSSVTGTSYAHTGLTSGSTYYYRVSATNTNGTSGYSSVVNATTAASAPVTPTGLAASGFSSTQNSISWNGVGNATSYDLQVATTSGGTYSTLATGITGTSYQHTGLAAGVTRWYKVRATNAAGSSAYSSAVSATTPTYATQFHVTPARRLFVERFQVISLYASAGVAYISTSLDGSTWRWFAGPLTNNNPADPATLDQLTEVASEALAQQAVFTMPTVATGRVVLPVRVEARFVRLHHRNSAAYLLYEFYPQDSVRASTIVGEYIRGFKIVANQLVTDSLAAVAAATGTLSVSGALTLGTNGSVRTASDETVLDATGISVLGIANPAYNPQASIPNPNQYRVRLADGTTLATFTSQDNQVSGNPAAPHTTLTTLRGIGSGSNKADTYVLAETDNAAAQAFLIARRGGVEAGVYVTNSGLSAPNRIITLTADYVYVPTVYVSGPIQASGGYVNGTGGAGGLTIQAGTEAGGGNGTGGVVIVRAAAAGINPSGVELWATKTGTIQFQTSYSSAGESATPYTRMTIDKYGYVGINTGPYTPTDPTTNANGVRVAIFSGASNSAGLAFATYFNGAAGSGTQTGFSITDQGSVYIRGAVVNGLNVGSGTTGATDGQIKTSGNVTVGGNLSNTGFVALHGATFDANIACAIKGVGTGSGTRGLRVLDSASNTTLDVLDNGNVTVKGTLTTGSDRRYKTNLRMFPYSDADLWNGMQQIDPWLFDRIGGDTNEIGFIAQHLLEVFPLAANYNADADRYGLNALTLIALLWRGLHLCMAQLPAPAA